MKILKKKTFCLERSTALNYSYETLSVLSSRIGLLKKITHKSWIDILILLIL